MVVTCNLMNTTTVLKVVPIHVTIAQMSCRLRHWWILQVKENLPLRETVPWLNIIWTPTTVTRPHYKFLRLSLFPSENVTQKTASKGSLSFGKPLSYKISELQWGPRFYRVVVFLFVFFYKYLTYFVFDQSPFVVVVLWFYVYLRWTWWVKYPHLLQFKCPQPDLGHSSVPERQIPIGWRPIPKGPVFQGFCLTLWQMLDAETCWILVLKVYMTMLWQKRHWPGGFWFLSTRFLHSTEAFFYRMDADLFRLILHTFGSHHFPFCTSSEPSSQLYRNLWTVTREDGSSSGFSSTVAVALPLWRESAALIAQWKLEGIEISM